MFDRQAYKQIAKKQLKGRYATPVLITLFVLAIALITELPQIIPQIGSMGQGASVQDIQDVQGLSGVSFIMLIVFMFINGVTSIAIARFYIIMSRTTEKQSFQTFIKGFSLWLQGFLAYLWQYLWVFLWALLFIVPGIVKTIAYSQMYYILAEHPNVGIRKAMKLSMTMTKGYKGDLFVMYLSFLGWAILSAFTFGILYLWLEPYMEMSLTNAYHALKAQALKNGILTMEDFGPTASDLTGDSAGVQHGAEPGQVAEPSQDETPQAEGAEPGAEEMPAIEQDNGGL